ncbi:outer membrane protein [Aureimonas glaciei]|jgi:outer membrane immunogenic protein|uniref:Membrane protein n=1 Tax=Aureimonas glaciei TaxID=1776957 RepID=A0A916Y1P8_9HYPH|nr:outer membrane protein [Aureimonas glaciei]GGD26864.1 membrane protein [Aureimonas glaciei]
MKRIALALAAVSLGAVPSLAADVVYDEPPAPMAMAAPAASWTGLYIGIQGGGAFNPEDPDNISLNTNGFAGPIIGNGVDAFGNNFDSSFDSSFVGGAHLGYDYQMGSFVLGAILDINAIDVKETASAFSNTPAFYTAQRSLDFLATARLRAGYTVTPSALAYVTGGLAYGEVDYGFSTDSPAVTGVNPAAIVNEDEDDFGFTVGAGMEVLVTDNISFGAEYLYTNLGGGDSFTRLSGGPFDGSGAAVIPGNSTDFRSDGDFDFHTVTAKLSYRFN